VDSSQAQLQQALGDAFVIERELGGGGMSRVFLATEQRLKRRVVVKLLAPEQASAVSAARFKQEIELAAHLRHPHILPVLTAGARDGLLYYVMPYAESESLRHRLARERPLPVAEAVRIIQEIADALEYANNRGVVHRDVKPENILLEGDHAALTDFGVARAIVTAQGADRLTGTGLGVGTPGYMAPEQVSGEKDVDARADIYALAVVGYEMLAGVPPFTGPNAQAVLAAHLRDAPPDLHQVRPEVPEALARAVSTALAKDPAHRFATAAEFRDAVVAGAGPLPRRPRALTPIVLGIAAGVIVALGSAITWYWRAHHLARVDPDVVAIAPFDVLDDGLGLWHEGMVDVLSRNLDGAGPLKTVAPSVVIRQWSGRADRRSAVALGRRTGAGLAVFGNISQSGPDSVHASATLVNVASGRSIGDVEAQDAQSHIDRLCDSLSVRLLRELSRVRRMAVSLGGSIGSSSLPAIKAYLQGEQWYRASNWDSAEAAYNRAIAADSTFALAWLRASFVRGWKGGVDDELAVADRVRAGRLNHGLAPRDSLIVAFVGQTQDRDNWAQMIALDNALLRRYPNDPEIWYLTGELREHLGDVPGHYFTSEQIIDAFDRSIAGDSQLAPAYIHPIEQSLALDDTARALRYIHAYLALDSTGTQANAVRMVRSLVAPGIVPAARETALRAASFQELFFAQGLLFKWPDSAERDVDAVTLMRSPGREPPGSGADSLTLRYELAGVLAMRGHVHRALIAAGEARPPGIVFNAALAGLIPNDSVAGEATALLSRPSPQLTYAIPWWGAARDSGSLRRAAAALKALARAGLTALDTRLLALGEREAPAYLALARGDSLAARRLLAAIPDSLCAEVDCTPAHIAQAELLADSGRRAEALTLLPTRNVAFGSPLTVPMELLRAHLLESLGKRAQALDSYTWITKVWRAPDAALMPIVDEARAGIGRLTSELGTGRSMLDTTR
jgi:tRNA A-37 threonylcarbamoyl transferase component Bud32